MYAERTYECVCTVRMMKVVEGEQENDEVDGPAVMCVAQCVYALRRLSMWEVPVRLQNEVRTWNEAT